MKLFDEDGADINYHHIDVLDGIRAFAILVVCWLHIWQVNWLMPILNTPALSFLRIDRIDIDWIPRTGSMMVNMLIFLSGFCLYLPYARNTVYGDRIPDTKTFFKKRVARIIPSYIFCVLAIFIFRLIQGSYSDISDSTFMWKDLLTRLTFTFNLLPQIGSRTLLNGALWTVAVEVQFYIIFPFLQKAFSKRPVLTYTIMTLVSFVYIFWATGQTDLVPIMCLLPSYLGVYANGFMGALIFTGMTKTIKRNRYIAMLCTVISLGCFYVYYLMMFSMNQSGELIKWQMKYRFHLSVLFMVFCIVTAYSVPFYRKIFSNRVAVFLSTISFNLYMWHQFIAVELKENKIPYYPGNTDDTMPNVIGDKPWMWKHFILSIVLSLLMATLTTYLIEKPCSKLILGRKKEETAKSSDKAVSTKVSKTKKKH